MVKFLTRYFCGADQVNRGSTLTSSLSLMLVGRPPRVFGFSCDNVLNQNLQNANFFVWLNDRTVLTKHLTCDIPQFYPPFSFSLSVRVARVEAL